MFLKKIRNLSNKRKLLLIISFALLNIILYVSEGYYINTFIASNLSIPLGIRIMGLATSVYFLAILPIIFFLLPFLLFKKTPKQSLSYIGFKGSLLSYCTFPLILLGIYIIVNLVFQEILHFVPSTFQKPYSFVPIYAVSMGLFIEEVFFRGILIKLGLEVFYKKGGFWAKYAWPSMLIISSCIFALFHLPGVATSLSDIFNFFLRVNILDSFRTHFFIGLGLGFIYLKFKNLKYPILAHYLFNLSMTLFRIYL